jgi:hypothetical protein
MINIKIVTISILVLIVIVGVMFNVEAAIIPTWINSTINKVRNPADLYEPIVLDEYEFWSQGYTKTYKLLPKYSDFYAIGIKCQEKYIPSGYGTKTKYRFGGKLKVDFYHKDELLFSEEISGMKTIGYVKNDMHHLNSIELSYFEIPLQGKYKKDISVRLTVIEPDDYLKNYQDAIKLTIGVSTTP